MESEPKAPCQLAATAPSVLIVDQDFMARWQAADYLREHGYNVIEATGVSDAVSLLESGMHIDIIFSDLPTADVPESHVLAQWLQKHHLNIPHLFISAGSVEPEDLLPKSKSRSIEKPYVLADIASHLKLLMQR